MSQSSKAKKTFDLEELLGLNVRSDRIVLDSVDDDISKEVEDIPSFDWSKYSIHGETETSLLSEDQVDAIKKLSSTGEETDAKSTVVAVDALILVLKGETNKNTIRYILLLLEKIFNYDNTYSASILSQSNLSTLCSILNEKMHELDSLHTPVASVPSDRTESTRRLIVLLSGFLCSVSLSEDPAALAEPSGAQAELRATFLAFVLSSFSAVSQKSMDEMDSLLVISGLAMYLRYKPNRVAAVEANLLPILSTLFNLCVTNAVQFVYELLLCIWMISFLPETLPLFGKKHLNVVERLAESLNTYSSEKIIRVIVNIVQNLIKLPELVEDLIACGAIRKLNLLNQRVFKDEDISETLKVVLDVLNANYDVLTSFDLYVKELETGVLHAGPRHTDDFWKENVRSFEQEDFKLIRKLIECLGSKDVETVCIACHDLGAFACYYPNGRKIVAQFHGKEKVMALLASENSKVVDAALSACSRLMINNWEELERGAASSA